MYFATGDGGNAIGESYTASSDKLYSIHPISATTLDLIFDSGNGYFDSVRLTITSGKHKTVISEINSAINRTHKSLIVVCDSDNSVFLNSNITDCVISLGVTASVTKVSTATAAELIDINTKLRPIKSISLANIHATDPVSVNMYLKNAAGTDYYIIKNVVIPFATTLVLDEDEVDYDTSVYNLYVKLSAGDSAVDVIIKNN